MVLTNPQHAFVSTGEVPITTTSPLDVIVTNEVQIDDPIDVNVQNAINIYNSTPIEVNVQQPVDISVSSALDVNVLTQEVIPRYEFLCGRLPTYQPFFLAARALDAGANLAVMVPDGEEYETCV